MKLFLIAATLLGGTFALSVTDASAAACARGVYRAGCVTR
jgi:ABC-type transport system involved in cytochrome c biogenesis permease component